MNTPLDNRGPTLTDTALAVWIWTDGSVGGPFPLSDVEALVASGEAPPGLLARVEGGEWMPWPAFADCFRPQPKEPVQVATEAEPPATPTVDFGFARMFLAISALLIGMVVFLPLALRDHAPGNRSAYRAAVQIVKAEVPGITSVSSFDDSRVSGDSGRWSVDLVVDGLNAFGGPVRRQFSVTLDMIGDDFQRVRVVQGPAPIRSFIPLR